uniref:NADH dehydrogenase [ubiquinone] 1 beta subcomplex subunit 7 n=1 Tax=Eutreptiella gymnastica TaxID=73025 RepID=A0A7S1IQ44_9EUGL|mmetsp:Transcript_32961/g.59061  ORF Transcript_32961/g.59061 Transcript_32961/m.59061 type:complete len:100 (+) Transcript_32961:39-338(+)
MPTPYDNDQVSYEGVDWEKVPNKYKKRPMPMTTEEMDEWQIPWLSRDYCVDKYVEYRKCMLKTVYNDMCMHDKHVYHQCQFLEIHRRKAIKDLREELGR